MDLPTFPIQDQFMIYHRAVCEALELPHEDFSPPQVVAEIRSLMASAGFAPALKVAAAERARIVGQLEEYCRTLRRSGGKGPSLASFLEEIVEGIRGNDPHDTQDGEEEPGEECDCVSYEERVALFNEICGMTPQLRGHDTLQDGTEGAEEAAPGMKGSSVSPDNPSGTEG